MADLAGEHLDHVEAHGNVREAVFLQVQLGRAQYVGLLLPVHGLGGPAVAGGGAPLDLHEQHDPALPGDDVDLPEAGRKVASDDRVTALFEEKGFACVTEKDLCGNDRVIIGTKNSL